MKSLSPRRPLRARRPKIARSAPSPSKHPRPSLTICVGASRATRWPGEENVADTSQGVPLAPLQDLARLRATDYDWRKCEAKLNALPQFHQRDRRARRPPYPRAVEASGHAAGHHLARVARFDPRADQARRPAHRPTAFGGRCSGRFRRRHPVDPGSGFWGKPTETGWDHARMARAPSA